MSTNPPKDVVEVASHGLFSRVLEPDEAVIQHLEQRLQGTDYGDNITLAHGELRWIAESFQTIKRQRDEARSIAERFRTYVPEDAIVPLFIPWENAKGDAPGATESPLK